MIFLFLFFVFLVGWIIFWGVFHVLLHGGIYLLLALAIIFLVIHFARRHHPV